MREQRAKAWIGYVGGALALLCAAWAMYLDIASGGTDPWVMRWFAAALGIVALAWALSRIVGKRFGAQRAPPSISS